jgi:BetR domain
MSTSPTDDAVLPYAEAVARNVLAEVARAGKKKVEVEAALNLSHHAALRRLNGDLEWKLSELAELAAFLNIDPVIFFTIR